MRPALPARRRPRVLVCSVFVDYHRRGGHKHGVLQPQAAPLIAALRLATRSLLIGCAIVAVVDLLFFFLPLPDWIAEPLLVTQAAGLLLDLRLGHFSSVREFAVDSVVCGLVVLAIRFALARRGATRRRRDGGVGGRDADIGR